MSVIFSKRYETCLIRSLAALRRKIINAWIPHAFLALCVFAPTYAIADYITVGTFEWADAAGDQATHEANGNFSGLGTSFVEIGHPAAGLSPNMMEFAGASGEGDLPVDFFNLGSITSFNGGINFASTDLPFPLPIILSVAGLQCDDEGLNCVETASGQTLISLILTNNTDDIFESADSFCMDVFGGSGGAVNSSQI